jgi:tmRNA-binding protein
MRTHRRLLVLNYIVTRYDDDSWFYCEWQDLKKYLNRRELIQLINNVKSGKNYIVPDNGIIHSIQGV